MLTTTKIPSPLPPPRQQKQQQQSFVRRTRRPKRKPIIKIKYCLTIFVCWLVSAYLGIFSLFLQQSDENNTTFNNNLRYNYNQQQQQQQSRTTKLPPLEKYIQGWNITGDVSWLLDFSIVGFPKTGTSTLMFYLRNQTQSIFTFQDERCEIGWNQHVPLLKELYQHYQGPHMKMGIKCPNNLEVDIALNNYNTYFKKTKFIVGVRNPIKWFESFYNHRITNEFDMPRTPSKLIGKCKRFNMGVCTNRANFTQHLSKIESWRKVFIYDVEQLQQTTNTTQSQQFLHDLSTFLELNQPLIEPMIWIKPGQKPSSKQRGMEIESMKMNICQDNKFDNVKKVLQTHASESSTWIINTFIKNPNVFVSSRDYFTKLINDWQTDVCTASSSSSVSKK